MIQIKTKEEIAIMREGGRILAETLWKVIDEIKPGVSELALDRLAEKLIVEGGAESGFKRVKGYHHTICVSTKDIVVHGIPTDYRFRAGDVVGIDCGVYFKGFHTDMAETTEVNSSPPMAGPPLAEKLKIQSEIYKFLTIGKRALEEAIKVARSGNRVGHISKTIQDIVEKEAGFSIVRTLVGHGVGKNLHEEPEVPGIIHGSLSNTPKLVEGMAIAIEVIYTMGGPEITLGKDGWTLRTKDGSLSGLFERTIAITDKEPIVLTS